MQWGSTYNLLVVTFDCGAPIGPISVILRGLIRHVKNTIGYTDGLGLPQSKQSLGPSNHCISSWVIVQNRRGEYFLRLTLLFFGGPIHFSVDLEQRSQCSKIRKTLQAFFWRARVGLLLQYNYCGHISAMPVWLLIKCLILIIAFQMEIFYY